MKKTRISEREAIDVLDFIIQKSGLFDKIIVNHVGSICSSKTMKNLYSVDACFSYYQHLVQNLTYGQHRFPVEIKSKLYVNEFNRIVSRRVLAKFLKISSNGYDIFYGNDIVLKKNTTLEQLLIEKDLSDNKE